MCIESETTSGHFSENTLISICHPCLLHSVKENEELEQKRQWVENEIEKIVAKQKDIALLEKELRGRDSSLRKKEALLLEKGNLEKKKSKTSLNISKVSNK